MGLIKAMLAICIFFGLNGRMNLTDIEQICLAVLLGCGVLVKYSS